ncbi:protein-L-isoaspartate(D-aspartate) O-methyltransferase [Patescibacteria group bacterium]|nr:protein-L-isoaspartate(D-aspartate) O-methyltransferase [Patescibacteria group bacterium]
MDYQRLREKMVKKQLIPRGIKDERILTAFLQVPRERFVPEEVREDAYGDFPLSIGEGQTISQPYMVALMTQCLDLKGKEKVLEIGTGSGYQTAILAELSGEVYSVERIRIFAQRAGELLRKLKYNNVKILVGNGTLGWKEFSPYDRIIVTAGTKDIPPSLIHQLKEDGVMVIPVGDVHSQDLKVLRKKKEEIITQAVERCIFVPLIGKYGWGERVD